MQHVVLLNLLRLAAVELISGDAQGNVIIFSNGEILSRSSMGAPVTALTVETDLGTSSFTCGSTVPAFVECRAANRSLIVAGDQEGTVSAFQSHDPAWSVRLVDFAAPRNAKLPVCFSLIFCVALCVCLPLSDPVIQQGPYPPGVRCLQPVTLKDAHGTLSHYLIAVDGRNLIQLFNAGKRLFALEAPSRVNAVRT